MLALEDLFALCSKCVVSLPRDAAEYPETEPRYRFPFEVIYMPVSLGFQTPFCVQVGNEWLVQSRLIGETPADSIGLDPYQIDC